MSKTVISAKVVADSKNEFGNRITTMVVTFPRIILSEFNTHRMFSRNSASSRAIPFEKMVKSVKEDPFIPIAWQKDHKGMQGTEYHTDSKSLGLSVGNWLLAKDNAIKQAVELSNLDVTKQLCNRLLEPFMWHTVIVTATEWENFFALRCPQYEIGRCKENSNEREWKIWRSKKQATKEWNLLEADNKFWLGANKGQAEIHMMALAEAMWDAYNESTPKELKAGEWHMPFGDGMKVEDFVKDRYPNNFEHGESEFIEQIKVKISTARCARVSYTVVGQEGRHSDLDKDIELHDRLLKSGHLSPFEHCAKAMDDKDGTSNGIKLDHEWWSGNLRGFIQYRKTIKGEAVFGQ